MNVKIGSAAVQFPEKEYIKGIFVAVCVRIWPDFLRIAIKGQTKKYNLLYSDTKKCYFLADPFPLIWFK